MSPIVYIRCRECKKKVKKRTNNNVFCSGRCSLVFHKRRLAHKIATDPVYRAKHLKDCIAAGRRRRRLNSMIRNNPFVMEELRASIWRDLHAKKPKK